MIKGLGKRLAETIFKKIKKCKESPTIRASGHEKAFTRDRKLTAERIVTMIIMPAKQSLQTRLYEFGVKFMEGVYATKQAFSKQRQFVNPDYIREFYDEGVEEIISDGELEKFKGMHLTAIDGVRIACENTPELINEFGCSGSKKDACTALASAAYDVITRVSYDCQIGSYSLSERDLLNRHLHRLESFNAERFLIIADRGYPSYELMETLIDRGFSFVLRLGENWKNVISWLADTNEDTFQYEYKGNTYSLRALKIELEDKNEYLITDLDSATLSLDEAKHIYSLRWNIETFFGFVKTELELENFSGKTKNAVLQEFYATMTLANLCLCFINDADSEIAAKQESKSHVYVHQANRRQCVGQIVPKFLECIFTDSKRKRDRLWKEVERFCERFSEPIRPGRNPERKAPRDKKFYANARKPNLS
jgi:hypothetical protein